MKKTILTIAAALMLAASAHADEDDNATDTWQVRCTCSPEYARWIKSHPHKNRIFGFVEKCGCPARWCHCTD
jgi:hypothetical protein